MEKIVKRAFLNSIGTMAYVIIVVLFLFSLESFFPKGQDIVIIPVAMLMLFVCSAAITGFLVFGKPVMLYIDGKKNEALALLGYTIGFLLTITLILFVILILYYNLLL